MTYLTAAKVGRSAAPMTVLRRCFAVVFILFSVGYIVTPTAAEAQSYRFTQVTIEGNLRVDAATILTYAGIAQGDTVSAGELNAAYQRILGSGLFEKVDIEPRGNRLLITVVEYPTINRINIEGNKRLKDKVLESLIRSQSRQVYNPATAESDAQAISEAYESAGRLSASVTPKIIRRSENRVDLVFEVSEGKPVEIERLSFVGNRVFSDKRLRRVLQTKQAGLLRQFIRSDTYIADRIDFDRQVLSDFYLSRGYVDFQTLSVNSELARNRDGTFVTFTIREGQQFKFGETSTISEIISIDPEAYDKLVKIRSGQVYSPQAVENVIARMENLALREGHQFVRIEPRVTRNDRDLTLDLEFAIVRGPRVFVERIDIEGNTTTLDRVVRRQFKTVEGDPFNPREIREAAERIRALGYFSVANVDTREGSGPSQVIVDVDVEETTTGSLGLGASYSGSDGIGFVLSYEQTNFLGRGQGLTLSFNSVASSRAFTVKFVEPNVFDRDLALGLNASYGTTEGSNRAFDTKTLLFSPSLGFPVSERGRMTVRYRYSEQELLNIPHPDAGYPGTSSDSGSSSILIADEGVTSRSGIGLAYSFDSRRSKIDERTSFKFDLGADLNGLGGDPSYSLTASAGLETSIFQDEVNIRAELEGGMTGALNAGGTTTIHDRFFLASKIRGFDVYGLGPRDLNVSNQDALGGNFYAVARLEADFPIGFPEEYGIRGGLFFDVGSVWGLDNTAGGPFGAACPVADCTVDDSLNIRSTVGLSVFWNTPIGPLRFNFSKALQKESYDKVRNFDLTISTKF